MHLLYVDESGDTGRHNPENHTFVLCGLMVHHADWHEAQAAFADIRQRLCMNFGLPTEAEIHASELLGRSPHHFKLDRMQRVKIALHALEVIRGQGMLTPIRVVVDKRSASEDILSAAWRSMLGAAKAKIYKTRHLTCSSHGLIVICDDHRTPQPAVGLNGSKANSISAASWPTNRLVVIQKRATSCKLAT
jgi:hypothetical protein